MQKFSEKVNNLFYAKNKNVRTTLDFFQVSSS